MIEDTNNPPTEPIPLTEEEKANKQALALMIDIVSEFIKNHRREIIKNALIVLFLLIAALFPLYGSYRLAKVVLSNKDIPMATLAGALIAVFATMLTIIFGTFLAKSSEADKNVRNSTGVKKNLEKGLEMRQDYKTFHDIFFKELAKTFS